MSAFGETLSFGLAIAGIALVIGEAIAPGAHLIVLGVALLAAGLFGIFVPEAAEPLVLAAVVIGSGAATLLVYRQFDLYGGSGEKRTADSSAFRGRRGFVTERVTARDGRVELYEGGFDSTFSARSAGGEPIEPETEIVVIDPGGGSVLEVAPVAEADRYLGGGEGAPVDEGEQAGSGRAGAAPADRASTSRDDPEGGTERGATEESEGGATEGSERGADADEADAGGEDGSADDEPGPNP